MDYSGVLDELKKTADLFFENKKDLFEILLDRMAQSLLSGQKILVFGNGGSAAQAQHFAAELVNKFLEIRAALPAISLTTDTSALTSIANDLSFEQVFSRQIEALGKSDDIVLGLSTSGDSPNMVAAMRTAKDKGLLTVGMTGRGGGKMASVCDFLLDVPSNSTPRIQEVHLVALHMMALEMEKRIG
jgi:D-sedoheptulose 7-phosphate isomerase